MNATIYNSTFLNSLFTAEEFKFIKGIDSDSQKYEKILKKEIKYRDAIVTFINAIRGKMIRGEEFEENENLAELLKTSQECFDMVNSNVKQIQSNKETSDKINNQIVELLINVESEEDNLSASKFYDQASNLKEQISNFTENLNNSKLVIEANDILIENFINREVVKKYLPSNFYFDEETSIEEIAESHNGQDKSEEINTVTESIIVAKSEDIKEDNDTLLVSEKERMVYLPYSKDEVLEYMVQYPNQYSSFWDVVKKEFIFPIEFYIKHPALARFRETYALIRDRESKTIIDAFKLAMDTMFQHDLNPAIIAACKSQRQFENYLDCLEKKKVEDFSDFKIKFEVTPLKA